MKIILGSQSPRRRELLAGLDIEFESINIDADEHYPLSLKGGDIPLYISRAKAKAFPRALAEDELLITADTIVWLNGKVLGKPKDAEDAKHMLRSLSGKTHQVYTGVTFTTLHDSHSLVDCTDVQFTELSDEEIDYYIKKYQPFDKAGSYGVQEYIGYIGVKELHGSYYNVMGFPVEKVYSFLKKIIG